MLNIVESKTFEKMSHSDRLDVLEDAQRDVDGVARTLLALAEHATDNVIEPSQLEVLGNVLAFAADGLGALLHDMDNEHSIELLKADESLGNIVEQAANGAV